MIGICKILFDLSFYYTLSGFYLYLFSGTYPSIWGVPVLMLSALVYMAIANRKPNINGPSKRKILRPGILLCCALPGLLLVFSPAILQIIQYLPAWAFFGYTIWNGLVNTDRKMFEDHFGFTGKLYLLLLFGILAINTKRLGAALTGAIPYLIIYLLTGVCLMRILREDGKLTKGRNVAILLALLFGSIALAGLQTPQLILNIVGFLYRNVIAWVIVGVVVAVGTIVYGIISIFAKLFSFLNIGNSGVNMDPAGFAQDILGEDVEIIAGQFPAWLRIAAAMLLVLAVAYVIFLIMRKLLGKKSDEKKRDFYTEEHENLQRRERSMRNGLLRPKDPRQAVRWYYRKYLKEGASKRKQKPIPADTSMDILQKYSPFFPENEAEELRELYIIARYRQSLDIPRTAADTARDLWDKMMRSADRKGIGVRD